MPVPRSECAFSVIALFEEVAQAAEAVDRLTAKVPAHAFRPLPGQAGERLPAKFRGRCEQSGDRLVAGGRGSG